MFLAAFPLSRNSPRNWVWSPCLHNQSFVNDGCREIDEAWALFITFSIILVANKLQVRSRNGRSKVASVGRKLCCMHEVVPENSTLAFQVFLYANKTQKLEKAINLTPFNVNFLWVSFM